MRTTPPTCILAYLTVVACATPQGPPVREPVPAPALAPEPGPPTQSVIRIAEEIRRACGIADADAHFAFDSARLETADYPVLQKIVACFTSGPRAGRQLRLVGHADPRGDEEYNLLLGGSRADGVKGFLVERGLAGQQAATSSRGEMDASGVDAQSWAADRRVDVVLVN
jgi:peptidoglycan-associated lipoprotein